MGLLGGIGSRLVPLSAATTIAAAIAAAAARWSKSFCVFLIGFHFVWGGGGGMFNSGAELFVVVTVAAVSGGHTASMSCVFLLLPAL